MDGQRQLSSPRRGKHPVQPELGSHPLGNKPDATERVAGHAVQPVVRLLRERVRLPAKQDHDKRVLVAGPGPLDDVAWMCLTPLDKCGVGLQQVCREVWPSVLGLLTDLEELLLRLIGEAANTRDRRATSSVGLSHTGVVHDAEPYSALSPPVRSVGGRLHDVLTAILDRRSIRSGYEDRAVPDEVIERTVQCGLVGPSSKNAQPWRIHVVTDRPLLAELADAVRGARGIERYVPIDPATGRPREDWDSTVVESAEVLAQVPLGLFIENRGKFSDGRRTVAAAAETVREDALVGYGFEMLGLGAAIQSMWIGARAQGLEGVFMGDVLIAEATIRRRLGMMGDLVGVLVLGYTSGRPSPKELADDRVVRHRRTEARTASHIG